jgi:hypothetical protein
MPKFKMIVEYTVTKRATIEVEAENDLEAGDKAEHLAWEDHKAHTWITAVNEYTCMGEASDKTEASDG